MPLTDDEYMQLAIDESYIGMKKGDRPFASILVNQNGNIVYKAHNTVLEECNPVAHGEINVISSYCRQSNMMDLEGYTLYATSEPCPMCAAAIGWANISRLVFGGYREDFDNPGYVRQNVNVSTYFKEQRMKIEVTDTVLRDKVIKMYKDFKAQ